MTGWRQHLKTALVLCVSVPFWVVSGATMGDGLRIAVIDQVAALLDSNEAQTLLEDFKADIENDRKKIRSLEKSLTKLNQRLEKDAMVLSQSETAKIEASIQDKQLDRNVLIKKIKNKNQAAQQQIMNQMGPKMEKVLTELQETENYDLILARQSLIWATPALDITEAVTQRLNSEK